MTRASYLRRVREQIRTLTGRTAPAPPGGSTLPPHLTAKLANNSPTRPIPKTTEENLMPVSLFRVSLTLAGRGIADLSDTLAAVAQHLTLRTFKHWSSSSQKPPLRFKGASPAPRMRFGGARNGGGSELNRKLIGLSAALRREVARAPAEKDAPQ